MPVFSLHQISYMRTSTNVRNEQLVRAWLDRIVATNYYLYSNEETAELHLREDSYKHHRIPASISSQALQEMTNYCQNTREYLSIHANYLQEPFACDPGIDPDEKAVYLSVDSSEISGFPASLRNYRRFIDQIELLYQHWHPFYSFLWIDDGNSIVSREDAFAGKIPGLYEINIFGPELVAQVGRERLLTAPAWHVKEFDDGGIILVAYPFSNDDPDFPVSRRLACTNVAEHVGLPFLQY